MRRTHMPVLISILMFCISGGAAHAAGRPFTLSGDAGPSAITSTPAEGHAAAKVDTVYLIGGPYLSNGDFQDADGSQAWDGWTAVDCTAPTTSHWNVSTYLAAALDPSTPDNHAWWCGNTAYNCVGDVSGSGYGNDWHDILEYRAALPPYRGDKRLLSLNVAFRYQADYDADDDEDDEEEDSAVITVHEVHDTVDPPIFEEPIGTAGNDTASYDLAVSSLASELIVRLTFRSDGRWSDEDCGYQSAGAIRVDNIKITLDGVLISHETCEPGDPADWSPVLPQGVGNFGRIWPLLQDIDPCHGNQTPQAAFIDDGIVVPGTGGSGCTSWCYGPTGYVVNPVGGLAGPDFYLNSEIRSPVLEHPGSPHYGTILRFSVYNHQTVGPGSPGLYYTWRVRSTSSTNPDDIEFAPWRDRGFAYYGGANYERRTEVLGELVRAYPRWIQVALGVRELGQLWGWQGTDATPAPYFDDVELLTFAVSGPAMSARTIDLAQDAFPESGSLNLASPGQNNVRFDMARNVAPQDWMLNVPGDSVLCDVYPLNGSLLGLPRLYYQLRANPLFDPYRTHPTSGSVAGAITYNAYGHRIPARFNFDLPDTGLLFPGDVLHYYFRAQESTGQASLVPPDTTGFGMFGSTSPYARHFTVRALPTLYSTTPGGQPAILFWDDTGRHGARAAWRTSLHHLGYHEGADYDEYFTLGPTSGVGNGLGGRATVAQLDGYETILYAGGDLEAFTLANGDPEHDPSEDIQVLDGWLGQGGKGLLLAGENIAWHLSGAGTVGTDFLADWISVTFVDRDVRPLIGVQYSPTVLALPGNPVIDSIGEWVAYGACPDCASFDAVTATGGAIRLAEFLDPGGGSGAYSYAAATLKQDYAGGSEVIFLPYDLASVLMPVSPSKSPAPPAARTLLLGDILSWFGHPPGGSPTDVAETPRFVLRGSHPNPFNPRTEIRYHLSAPDRVRIQVFDIRGRLVRTLVDGPRPAGSHEAAWDGTDGRGQEVAAGLYLARATALGTTHQLKMLLVK